MFVIQIVGESCNYYVKVPDRGYWQGTLYAAQATHFDTLKDAQLTAQVIATDSRLSAYRIFCDAGPGGDFSCVLHVIR